MHLQLPRTCSFFLLILSAHGLLSTSSIPCIGSPSTICHQPSALYISNSLRQESKKRSRNGRGLRRNKGIKIEGPETKFGRKIEHNDDATSPKDELRSRTAKILSCETGKMAKRQIDEATSLINRWAELSHDGNCNLFLEKILTKLLKENEMGNSLAKVNLDMTFLVSTSIIV